MKRLFEHVRRVLTPVAGAALAAGLLLPAQPAQAASQLTSFDADFTLTRVSGGNEALIESAEAAGVAKASVTEVLDSHTGKPHLCHGTGLNGALAYDGFCWDDIDDLTGYTDTDKVPEGGWMPQGFTGSHAAYAGGLYEGRHLYVASWYFGKFADGKPNEQYTRISIIQSTGDQVTYGHVALVEPTLGNFRELSYQSHADGIAWYGDRLFVANGVELQVYDLRHLWRMDDTSSAATGLIGGRASARYHRWALPLLARYTTKPGAVADTDPQPFGAGVRTCGPAKNVVCLSSLSVDRSTSSLVSAENIGTNSGARIVRWPLAQLGTQLPAKVTSASRGYYADPVLNVQGVATDGTHFYLSGDCPASWHAGYSCVHVAAEGEATHVLTQAPWLTQNLSWDPNAGRLWGLNEALEDKDVGGKRVVFSLNPSAGAAVDGWGWMSNFTKPGFTCATPKGDGTANGTIVTVWHCIGSESQRWAFKDGRLVHKASGKCLTPQADAEDTNGAVLTLWTCNGNASQLFKQDGGAVTNRLGKAVTPKGDSLNDGTYLTLWSKTGNDSQEWRVKGF
ncbi:RICIN domain-containing protein [Streptomyces sp. NPDC038707]|uniref:RICIN domain-containing protein n=1 Tax=Streptomyces sp. NPDC038707 TaxID=3154329 RepID=UPI0033D744A7